MVVNLLPPLTRALFFAVVFLTLSGCGPLRQEVRPRFFWPPPPDEAKIEYLNYYFSNEDINRGADRRLEYAILGRTPPERVITQPYSVASDGKGRIVVGDFAGSQVIIFDLRKHVVRSLLTTGGPPLKVAFDSRGEIWVLDSVQKLIHHYNSNEEQLPSIELEGMGRPSSFAVDIERKRLYVSDAKQHRIQIYTHDGSSLGSYGTRGSAPGEFNFPGDLDLDREGNLYVVDAMNARIQVLSPAGLFVRAFGERGTARGSFSVPKGIAVSPSNLVYVTDAAQHKIVIFDTEGKYLLTLGGQFIFAGNSIAPGGFYFPAGIDVDESEKIFVADLLNGMIHEFQYLTPAVLNARPIDQGEIYQPQQRDLFPKENVSPPHSLVPAAPVVP